MWTRSLNTNPLLIKAKYKDNEFYYIRQDLLIIISKQEFFQELNLELSYETQSLHVFFIFFCF